MLKPCLAFLSLSVDGGIFHQKTQVHHHRFEVKEARCFFPLRVWVLFAFSFSLEWRHCPSSPFCLVVFFSFLSGVWVVAFFSFPPSSFFWVVVLSLSLFVRGAAWVVLRLLFFRSGGAAFSLLAGWWSFLTPLLGGALSRSPAPQGAPLPKMTPTIEPEATQGGHIGRASPCEDRPLNGVCVRSKFACGIVGLCRYTVFQDMTRISKVAVVQVVLCVYVGGAWLLQGRRLCKVVRVLFRKELLHLVLTHARSPPRAA